MLSIKTRVSGIVGECSTPEIPLQPLSKSVNKIFYHIKVSSDYSGNKPKIIRSKAGKSIFENEAIHIMSQKGIHKENSKTS